MTTNVDRCRCCHHFLLRQYHCFQYCLLEDDKDDDDDGDDQCSPKSDTISKCVNLKNREYERLCDEDPYLSGCKKTCCSLTKRAGTTTGPLTTPSGRTTDCSELRDTASKCHISATRRNCVKEPYELQCKQTCCRLNDRGNDSTVEPGECDDYINTLSKCAQIKDVDECWDLPARQGCKHKCCKLGFDYDSFDTTTITSTTTVSGDVCAHEKDRAQKCKFLDDEEDPVEACKVVKFYADNCDLSCCLAKNRPTPSESTEAPTTLPVCNGKVDNVTGCSSMNLTEVECALDSFLDKCALTCCFVNGGEFSTTAGSTTLVPTTQDSVLNSAMFSDCTIADTGSNRYCAEVVSTHTDGSNEDLCQNPTIRSECMFSCCVYYYATDEMLPQMPDPLYPDECQNLEDGYPVKECWENYLNDECDIHCRLTCCLLEAAYVPVNPGCYDKDDDAKLGYCASNCWSEADCETDACLDSCAWTCCSRHTDTESNSSPEPTDSTEQTQSTDTPIDSKCDGLSDRKGYTLCMDRIGDDSDNCTPNATMYDTDGCNFICCHRDVELLTTLEPPTMEPTDTTTEDFTTEEITSTQNLTVEVVTLP